jgi:glycosyltransferase involved in cell wall biosynthesis
MFSSQRIPQVEARRKLQLPGEGPVLLFFGIVRPYKGLEYLLEAIRRSALQGVNPYLIVAGEFWEQKQHYLEIIERLELKDRVRLDNRYIPDEEVADYFSAADLFVAPYVQGTQSGSAHLALGFGLPVVASLSIVDETLMEREGSQTWLAQPGDADSLAIAIRTALQAVQAGNIPKPQVATVGGWERLAQVIEEWE